MVLWILLHKADPQSPYELGRYYLLGRMNIEMRRGYEHSADIL